MASPPNSPAEPQGPAPERGHEDYERCMAAIREVIRDLDDLDEYLREQAAKSGREWKESPMPNKP